RRNLSRQRRTGHKTDVNENQNGRDDQQCSRSLGHDLVSTTARTVTIGCQRNAIPLSGRPLSGWLVRHIARPNATKQPATMAVNRNQITGGNPTATMRTLPIAKISPPILPATSVDDKLICGDPFCGRSGGAGSSHGCCWYQR